MHVLLYTHIITGMLGLISGSAAFFQRKGGRSHKMLGKVFYWSMLISSATAVMMASLRNNLFLLVIGVFTVYLLLAGRNFLMMTRWRPARNLGLMLSGLMSFATVIILVLGIQYTLEDRVMGWVLLGFALISAFLVTQDFRHFLFQKSNFISLHIGRMVGAWIASWTAFLVVNQYIPYPLANWMLPTLVGVPVIVFWIRKMRMA